jgi:hypothetical protein
LNSLNFRFLSAGKASLVFSCKQQKRRVHLSIKKSIFDEKSSSFDENHQVSMKNQQFSMKIFVFRR